jgi:hypothetical protein
MNKRASHPNIVQAAAALGVAAGIAGLLLIAISSAASALLAKTKALAAHQENARALDERLAAAREETKARLIAIGAAPADLEILSDPAQASQFVKRACEELLGVEADQQHDNPASCQISEVPITDEFSFYRAQATSPEEADAFASRLPNAVHAPVRITSMTIEAHDGGPIVSIVLEAPGARSGGAE